MNFKLNSKTVYIIAGFIFVNLLITDVLVIKTLFSNVRSEDVMSATTQPSNIKIVQMRVCSVGCVELIKEATRSLSLRRSVQTTESSTTYVKEYYIPFGGGSNETDDWADVTGIQAYIDSTQYGKIKKVTFEASVNIPTGNEKVWVRLFNVTDKHPVWFSEVSHEGGGAKLLISDPITLDFGNKLYQVQMKTSLKFRANLHQARVHIMTL